MPAPDHIMSALALRADMATGRGDWATARHVAEQIAWYDAHATEWDAQQWGIADLGSELRKVMEHRISRARGKPVI